MPRTHATRRSVFDWQALAGALAFGCLLALSLPGIQIARAEQPAAQAGVDQSTDPGEALQCSPPAPTAQATSELARIRHEIQKREMAQADPEIVVLNSRGYTYAEPPQVQIDLDTLRREAARPTR